MVIPSAPQQKTHFDQNVHATHHQHYYFLVSPGHTGQTYLKVQTLLSLCWASYSQILLPLTIHHLDFHSDVPSQQISPVASYLDLKIAKSDHLSTLYSSLRFSL